LITQQVDNVSAHGSAAAQPTKETLRLKKACKDFETIFLSYMLKSMRKTVSKTNLLDSGLQGDIYQEMMDDEFCKAAAQTGSTGIADTVYRQLSKPVAEQAQTDLGVSGNSEDVKR
jgi:peptidoglycan hydrolase FlgJ